MQYAIDPNKIRAEDCLFGEVKFYDENGVYLGHCSPTFLHINYYDVNYHKFAQTKHYSEEEARELFAGNGYVPVRRVPNDDFFDGMLWGMILADSGRPREPNPIFETKRLRKK